jgi:hypothetical protein
VVKLAAGFTDFLKVVKLAAGFTDFSNLAAFFVAVKAK